MNHLKKRLSALAYPWPSNLVETINGNAKVAAWIKRHRAIPTVPRWKIYEYTAEHIVRGEPMDYLEFGVFWGASIKKWLSLEPHADTRMFGFDSFEGLPEKWTSQHGEKAFSSPMPDIKDPRVKFIKGWFQDTLPEFLKTFKPRSRLVIWNDSDLYSSTLFTLASLNYLIVPGTIIFFDEFNSALHEFRAFHDYLAAFNRKAHPLVKTANFAEKAVFEFD